MSDYQSQRRIAWVLRHGISNDNATPEERALTARLSRMATVARVKSGDITTLKNAFNDVSSKDPYIVSPTYYALTGRRGLWRYSDEDTETVVLFCLHPNIMNSLVIFPGFGEQPAQATVNLVKSIGMPEIDFQIGRVPVNSELHNIADLDHFIMATTRQEDILDWPYPVHTINCADLVKREGPKYGRIRQAMNKFERAGAQVRKIDFDDDATVRVIEKISRAWEDKTHHYEDYEVTLVPYFRHLVDIARTQPALNLQGLIVTLDGVDRGFSIWEPGYNSRKAANLFASQIGRTNADKADNGQDGDKKKGTSITNLGTFLHVKSAEAILEEGGTHMCLGGSENKTMDKYKRGFLPQFSTPLETIDVKEIQLEEHEPEGQMIEGDETTYTLYPPPRPGRKSPKHTKGDFDPRLGKRDVGDGEARVRSQRDNDDQDQDPDHGMEHEAPHNG